AVFIRRIHHDQPAGIAYELWQNETDFFVIGVEQHEKARVGATTGCLVLLLQALSAEIGAQAAGVRVVPLGVRHFRSVGFEPDDVLHTGGLDYAALKETAALKNRTRAAQPYHP